MKLYKVLHEDGSCCNGGMGKWHLPQGDKSGEWMPAIKGELVACENGYHLCREQDLVRWLDEAIYEAEYDGELIEASDKVVVRKARLVKRLNWNRDIAVRFALDCAEKVLPIYQKRYPKDERVKECLEVARKYLDGKATKDEVIAAARAAYAAADAAYAAAYAAADAAYAAAYAAAAAAAADAAAHAARAAAYAADSQREREWQTKRLMGYLYGRVK